MNSGIAIARARTWLDKVLRPCSFIKARDRAERIWSAARAKLDLSSEMASTNRRTRLARNILAADLPSPTRYLEIGSFEGGSLAFLHTLLDGRLRATVIDPFSDQQAHPGVDMTAVEARFRDNMKAVGVDVRVLRGTSLTRLPQLIAAGESFDLIYIDGSHEALDVMTDAVLCWRLLAPHGLMIFDDYHWRDCRIAINAFMTLVGREGRIIDLAGQVFVRRTSH